MDKITKEIFEMVVMSSISSTADVFDSMSDAIDIATDKLQNEVLGTGIKVQELEGYLNKWAVRFVCLEAFYESIPQLDLVLTATGFGVVSNQNVAPASAERVSNLRTQVRNDADDALDALILLLTTVESWNSTEMARVLINSVFFTARDLQMFMGMPRAHRSDLDEMRQRITGEEEKIRRMISNEAYEDLLDKLRRNDYGDKEAALIYKIRSIIGWAISPMGIGFKIGLEDISNYMEKNLESFPIYAGSEAYKVKHFKPFENEKENSCYFFG
jgi:hypothetical protein